MKNADFTPDVATAATTRVNAAAMGAPARS